MTTRVANKDARQYVRQHLEFRGSNLYGQWRSLQWRSLQWRSIYVRTQAAPLRHGTGHPVSGMVYVVFSYGEHYPMWVYDPQTERWYGNNTKTSQSTSRQALQTRPTFGQDITWLDTKDMLSISTYGYMQHIAKKLEAA